MRLFPNKFVIAVALLTVSGAASVHAQPRRSFEPNNETCEKVLGYPADHQSVPGERSFTGLCAELDLELEKDELDKLKEFSGADRKKEHERFESLLAAFESYRTADLAVQQEECGGGNSCGSALEWTEAFDDFQFLIMAEGFRGTGFPSFSSGEFKAADAALNAAYQKVLHDRCGDAMAADNADFCAPESGIRALQKAWIRYRDAWVSYGEAEWPRVSADSWRAYLTLLRTKELSPREQK
jgi:uncharacterized protein YecT (DUF1311 family)